MYFQTVAISHLQWKYRNPNMNTNRHVPNQQAFLYDSPNTQLGSPHIIPYPHDYREISMVGNIN